MNQYYIILMTIVSMASLQASDEFLNSLQSSASSSSYLQPSRGVSQLTADMRAADQAADERSCGFRTIETQIKRDDEMVRKGKNYSCAYRNNQLSEEKLARDLRDSQESPRLGVSASLAYGFNKDLRMDSPTFKSLKEKYNSPSSSPELREACKRKMKLILNN